MSSHDDGHPTLTSVEQNQVEMRCSELFEKWENVQNYVERPILLRQMHTRFLTNALLNGLPMGFTSLDASRPWIVYWVLHSMDLLGCEFPQQLRDCVIDFLRRCQHKDGGFGGGPGQQAHLAPTYAAVGALLTLGGDEAYKVIDREKLHSYLLRLKVPHGGFMVHTGGEIDTRGAYTALAVASMCNVLSPHVARNTASWLRQCQTYEGGIGGEPGNEAHGGYTFCGLAAMILLNKEQDLDLVSLLHWASKRQMALEGGFQGRSNKLVDGCYSYWVGAIFPLLEMVMDNNNGDESSESQSMQSSSPQSVANHADHLFDVEALQRYVLLCCQQQEGGLKDKPGKRPDYYHTCYTLSGLSLSQQFMTEHVYSGTQPFPSDGSEPKKRVPFANKSNMLRSNNALYNITEDRLEEALAYFRQQPRVE